MWNLAYADLSRVALGVHAVSNTSVLVAGGGGPIQAGPAVFASEDAGATWAAAPGIKLSMVNAIGASPHGRVAFGVSLYGQSIAFHAEGDDLAAAYKGSSDRSPSATSGQDVEWLGDSTFAAIGQFNEWQNKSACTVPASPQCSGVLLSRDGGDTFERYPWGGSDAPGVDARYAAFPSSKTWYAAGGHFPLGSGNAMQAHYGASQPNRSAVGAGYPPEPPGYRALVTKTTDGGATWATVFNDTSFNKSRMFYFNQIGCASEDECWAVAECPAAECPDDGYGMFIYHTADGGASWEEQYYEYEASALSLQVLPGRVVVGGGPVGVASNGFVWESTDGGKSWAKSILKGHGYVMDVDLRADGAGFAVSCVAFPLSKCAMWRKAA